jgi:hypothetical protein
VVLGLTLCDLIIVEEETEKVSLIGTFTKLEVEEFPSAPKPFCVFAALTNGSGDATIDLVVTRLDTDEDLYEEGVGVHFPGKLTEVQLLFRIQDWTFPAPGWYQFVLLVDGEWVAQRRLEVSVAEELS